MKIVTVMTLLLIYSRQRVTHSIISFNILRQPSIKSFLFLPKIHDTKIMDRVTDPYRASKA